MKHIDFFLFFLLIIITLSALIKANLVFEYKKSFEYLDKIQEKISSLQNQNTKLNLEISLIKSSPYIYEKAIELGMKEPDSSDP
tara:strand:+ start:2233 stop:2484 length:252 start_codon:yes stop_codon:yes gene_type:complete